MKNLILALAMMLGISLIAEARDEIVRDVNFLPETAKTTLSKNFKADVSFIKVDKTLGYTTEYEVVLTDGSEVNFDRDGNWDSIETPRNKAVPAQFIPKAMANYVAKNYSGTSIVSIDKERDGYDVELSNGLDIKFDKSGNFVRLDD